MKTTILSAIIMASISFAACNSGANKPTESSANQSAASTEQFSCPMHHEVVGKKGDKCSKCGMELTEPVTAEATTHTHDSADGHHHAEDGHHHD